MNHSPSLVFSNRDEFSAVPFLRGVCRPTIGGEEAIDDVWGCTRRRDGDEGSFMDPGLILSRVDRRKFVGVVADEFLCDEPC